MSESSLPVEESELKPENALEIEGIKQLEFSERQLSDRARVSRHALKKHRDTNPPGTPLEVEIDGKIYHATCLEGVKSRSPSKWIVEPIS